MGAARREVAQALDRRHSSQGIGSLMRRSRHSQEARQGPSTKGIRLTRSEAKIGYNRRYVVRRWVK